MEIKKRYSKVCIKMVIALIAFSLMFSLFVPVVNAAEIPTEKQITKQITSTYNSAIKWWGRSSFAGWCGHYVNLQLLFRGINTSYVGGNGNTEYDNYKNMTITSGGRYVHAYPATTAELGDTLRKIASQANIVTDILVGFEWSSTTAGRKYGHAFFIHAIIDGYVYFSDNYTVSIGGVTYKEGKPIKCTIDELVKYYGRESKYGLEGLIWFEDPELTAAQENRTKCQSTYVVDSDIGLRLRSGPGLWYEALDRMPDNTELLIVSISGNGWGKTVYNGVEGWCSLEYCDLVETETTTEDKIEENTETEEKAEIEVKAEVETETDAGAEAEVKAEAEMKEKEEKTFTPVYQVNYSTGLRLRSGPGTQYSRLLTMPNKAQIEILEISPDGWGRTIYNGVEGWCSLDYCTALNVQPKGVNNYRVDSSIGLRLRTGPGTENKFLLWLPDGLEIEVLHTSYNGWGQIIYNGQVGWCSLDYCLKID